LSCELPYLLKRQLTRKAGAGIVFLVVAAMGLNAQISQYVHDPGLDVNYFSTRLTGHENKLLCLGNFGLQDNTLSLVVIDLEDLSITSETEVDFGGLVAEGYSTLTTIPTRLQELEFVGVLWPNSLGLPWKTFRLTLNSDYSILSFDELALSINQTIESGFLADLKIARVDVADYVLAMTSITGSEIFRLSADWQEVDHTSVAYNPFAFSFEGRGFSLEEFNGQVFHVTEDSLSLFNDNLEQIGSVDFNTEFSTGKANSYSFISNASVVFNNQVYVQALSSGNTTEDESLDILLWRFDETGLVDSMFIAMPETSELFQLDVLTASEEFLFGGAINKEEKGGNIGLGEAVSFFLVDSEDIVVWTDQFTLDDHSLGLLDVLIHEGCLYALIREYTDENRLIVLKYVLADVLGFNPMSMAAVPLISPNPVGDVLKWKDSTGVLTDFKIISLDGRLVISGRVNSREVDTSNLPSGYYIFSLERGLKIPFVKE
jgi:hypothetical protein